MSPRPVPDADLHDGEVEQFVRTFQADVWRYLRNLGASPDAADDLTQDTFLIALKQPELDWSDATAIRVWLRRTARHRWLDRLRTRRRRREVDWADQVDLLWDDAEVDSDRWVSALEHCLDGLEGRAAEAVALRYREQRSRADIAARFGLRENGLKTLLQRVRRGLRDCVERRLQA